MGDGPARSAELSDQLGLVDERRPEPREFAQAVARGLGRPEVAAIRAKLRPEWTVAFSAIADGVDVATLGVADAVAVEAGGSVSTVVDWKSDEDPSERAMAEYRSQIGK